ncbi:zinc finger protein 501-like [Phlebotomus argentipes]|uniref:zinc finger protein 501-like n=1 Tax=Phlebotomus argentipes TaxID=94469 RepID=UPI0028934DC1|nr:zinc finger protein 501-like [Phlebotomus argentipes]
MSSEEMKKGATFSLFSLHFIHLCVDYSQLRERDTWPRKICCACSTKSRDCIDFFQKIKESEEKLVEIFSNFEESHSPEDTGGTCSDSADEVPVKEQKKHSRKDKEDSKKQKVLKTEDDLVRKYLGFKCDVCAEECRNYYSLKFHFRTRHGVKGYVVCCSRKFFALGNLVTHLQLHADPEAFKCLACSRIFLSDRTRRLHVESCSKSPEKCSFICDRCPRVFPSAKKLYFHRRLHASEEEKRYKCPDCPKGFLTPSELRHHRMKAHDKTGQTFVCDSCGKIYTTKCQLKRHVKQYHGTEIAAKVECGQCGGFYATRASLKMHQKRCKADPAVCQECGKLLSNAMELKKHIRYNHSGLEKKFLCQVCPKAFKTKKHLSEHSAKHSKLPRHKCSFCDHEFCTLSAKYSHQRIHHAAENAAAKVRKW